MATDYLKPSDKNFSKKLVDALNVGLRQMAEKAAKNNETLVIGYMDGTSASVPAKNLLGFLSKKGK